MSPEMGIAPAGILSPGKIRAPVAAAIA